MTTWAEIVASRGSVEELARVRWQESGVPARLSGYRLETFPLARCGQLQRELLARLRAPVVATWESFWCQSWYLWGDTGRGKTGLAVGYAYQWVDPRFGHPSSVVYWSVPELLLEIQGTYEGQGSEWRILKQVRETDLVVLDDLGREHASASGWAAAKLYQVINARYAEELPVVVTSNYSPAQLAERLGEAGGPVVWRLAEMCGRSRIVRVEGPNLRELEVLDGDGHGAGSRG